MNIAILVLLLSVSLSAEFEDTKIPDKYQGVWKIVAIVEDTGVEISSDDPEYPKTFPVELLIVGNRLVFVTEGGDANLGRASVLEDDSVLTLAVLASYAEDKSQTPDYYDLKIDGNDLTIELAVDRYEKDPRENFEAIPTFKAIREDR